VSKKGQTITEDEDVSVAVVFVVGQISLSTLEL